MNTLQNNSVQNLPVVFWQDQPVITTESLANVYETDVNNIQENFRNNKDRFEEGKHYFKLEGETLREFKKSLTQNNWVSRQTRNLILWTERGTVRHAKMLGTDKAWDVQEKLEQFYFSQKAAAKPVEKAEALTLADVEQLIERKLSEQKPLPTPMTRSRDLNQAFFLRFPVQELIEVLECNGYRITRV